jgi:hypothetical protein
MSNLSLPFQAHSDTSRNAAITNAENARLQRVRVYNFIAAHPDLTDEGISDGLGEPENGTRPRRVNLVEYGLVVQSGVVRTNRSGKPAGTWRIVPGVPFPDPWPSTPRRQRNALTGWAKAVDEIKQGIPEKRRSLNVGVILRVLDELVSRGVDFDDPRLLDWFPGPEA